ncbi:MAG: PUA domain-containing protein, partial [Solirubrobacteraceae bacterium]
LWIAYALGASGLLVVDAGARKALIESGRSLLPAGVVSCRGRFEPDDAVEIAGTDGAVFAKGLVRYSSNRAQEWVGRRSGDLPEDWSAVAVHRDDLVVLTPTGRRS